MRDKMFCGCRAHVCGKARGSRRSLQKASKGEPWLFCTTTEATHLAISQTSFEHALRLALLGNAFLRRIDSSRDAQCSIYAVAVAARRFSPTRDTAEEHVPIALSNVSAPQRCRAARGVRSLAARCCAVLRAPGRGARALGPRFRPTFVQAKQMPVVKHTANMVTDMRSLKCWQP